MDTSIIRKISANNGMVLTDTATKTLRSYMIYLGIADEESNYEEIPENTPLPDGSETVDADEATKEDLYNALAELGVE